MKFRSHSSPDGSVSLALYTRYVASGGPAGALWATLWAGPLGDRAVEGRHRQPLALERPIPD